MKATEQIIGRWKDVLAVLGVDRRFLNGKHGPCPLCAEGKDRFRFDDKGGKGTWICNRCGAGDGWALVMRIKGWDFRRAVQEIEPLIGTAQIVTARVADDEARVRRALDTIWGQGVLLSDIPEAAAYWISRLGGVPALDDVRAHGGMKFDAYKEFPGFVALVRDTAGSVVNMHRTFLAAGGQKAPVKSPRKLMALPLPEGCAIRLAPPGAVLGIAEGLETACAAHSLFGQPCWAVINANGIRSWMPPAGVRVVVFGDNDLNFHGQEAAFTLAHRLHREGFEVTVEIPPTPGDDWNDVLMDRLGLRRAA